VIRTAFLAVTLLFGIDQYVRMHGLYDHGYTDTQIAPDQWEVRYEGNPSFERRTVEFSALFRAAEVALANGYAWFEVIRDDWDGGSGSRTTYNKWSGLVTKDRTFFTNTLLIRGLKTPASGERAYSAWDTIQRYAKLVRLPSSYPLPTPPPMLSPPIPAAAKGPPTSSASGQGSAGLKPGFRDLKWGDGPTATMVFLDERADGERAFYRSSDALWIGPVPLTRIIYSFFSDQLRGVEMSVAPKDLPALTETLNGVWGQPQNMDSGNGQVSRWYSENSGSDNTVALLFRHGDRPATLQICNAKFYEARGTRAVSRKAKDDL